MMTVILHRLQLLQMELMSQAAVKSFEVSVHKFVDELTYTAHISIHVTMAYISAKHSSPIIEFATFDFNDFISQSENDAVMYGLRQMLKTVVKYQERKKRKAMSDNKGFTDALSRCIERTIRRVMAGQHTEEWVTAQVLTERMPMFTADFIRKHGEMLPRERMEYYAEDDGTTATTRWMYPLKAIDAMVRNGQFRTAEGTARATADYMARI